MCGATPCSKPNCTWSRQHLQACEARWIASKPGEWRAIYYEDVRKKRGPEALSELKRRVSSAWNASQQQPSLL